MAVPVVVSAKGVTSTTLLYTVPAGNDLVITYAWVSEAAGTRATIEVNGTLANPSTTFDVIGVEGGGTVASGTTNVSIPAGKTVSIFMSGGGPASGGIIGWLAVPPTNFPAPTISSSNPGGALL
jgi:hypothetical protein